MKWNEIPEETKRKLSPESKKLLMMEQPPDEEMVNIFLQTSHTPSERELREIEETGGRIQTVAQDVLTGKIAVEDIPKVAALEYVVKLELSLPLFPEEE